MAVIQKLVDHDQLFQQLKNVGTIILNDLSLVDTDDMERLNSKTMTVYNTDVFTIIPSCECGNLNKGYYKGRVCPKCNSEVVDPNSNVNPVIWMKAPNPRFKFINPEIWNIINYRTPRNVDILRWLSDTSYNPNVKLPTYLPELLETIGGERRYDMLIENLDKVVLFLATTPKLRKWSSNFMVLLELMNTHKDCVLSDYLPLHNKKLFVMENTSKGKYTNLVSADIVDLSRSFIGIINDSNTSLRKLSNLFGSIGNKLSIIDAKLHKTFLGKKGGLFRKNLYGNRVPFTFRGVITSVPGKHRYDELVIPHQVGVTVFRPMIMGKLFKRGYTLKKASKLLIQSVKTVIPLIREILDEILREAPDNKMPVVAGRNPSLLQGSQQLMYIIGFHKDPEIYSIQYSGLVAKNSNADLIIRSLIWKHMLKILLIAGKS
jgi:hypothetical protein